MHFDFLHYNIGKYVDALKEVQSLPLQEMLDGSKAFEKSSDQNLGKGGRAFGCGDDALSGLRNTHDLPHLAAGWIVDIK